MIAKIMKALVIVPLGLFGLVLWISFATQVTSLDQIGLVESILLFGPAAACWFWHLLIDWIAE